MPQRPTAAERLLASAIAVTALAIFTPGCDSPTAAAIDKSSDEADQAATSDSTAKVDDETAAKPSATPAKAERPKFRPGAKTKVLERAGDRAYDKTFDDLRFEMEVGMRFRREMLTEEIEELDGMYVRIRGYMLPTAQKRGVKQFVLVRDNFECCFGPGAALFDCILVEMAKDKTAEYTIWPVAVSGTFEIEEFVAPDGNHLAIYRMEAETVK